MTPQDIRERTLEKVLFTGYDMGAVDRLREECAEALAAKEKEVAVLSGKIKVLVTSVESSGSPLSVPFPEVLNVNSGTSSP